MIIHKIKTLHPIDAFGIGKVSFSSIRIEAIEQRVIPKVPFPHKHDFYQIMLVTGGTGVHQIDFERHQINKGQLFVMKPGQIHSWELKKNIRGFLIEFNEKSLAQTFFNGPDLIAQIKLTPQSVALKEEHYLTLTKLTELMLKEYNDNFELSDLSLQGYLTAMLIEIIRGNHKTYSRKEAPLTLVDKFRNLVELNYQKQHQVEFYARTLNVTPKALTMQLTRTLGKSPRFIIQERCLLEAKRYLAYTNLTVAEIAYQLGFEDPNYFSRFFKKYAKCTPLGFRQAD